MSDIERNLILKFSPNVRLRMTFEREMLLDDEGKIFNDALHQKYLDMHSRSVAKQDSILKTLLITDCLLALLLFGKNVTIPGTPLSLQDIPAAIEVLTLFASFNFMVLSLAFANTQAYAAICDQFTNRLAAKACVDPDFISAAHISKELYLKLFRPKFNIFGEDFFEAGRAFRIFYFSLTSIILLAMLSVFFLHMSVVGYGVWKVFNFNWFSILFCSSVLLTTTAGIFVNFSPSFGFTVKNKTT